MIGSRESGIGSRLLAAAVLIFLAAAAASAQVPAKPPADVAVAPIECWWKTDRSAIRVGERFELTLTCAVIDTDQVKVVVDESSLAPSALHLVPFEIVGGQRFRDIFNRPRRFFQYQYSMRVLGEEFFGKDVSLPRLQISYRVQNALNGGSALSGREELYSLRPVPIQVLSLVASTAADIRDTPPETFGDIDARLFRSNLLLLVAGVAMASALLLVVVSLVRATVKRRSAAATRRRVVSPALVLYAASRELSVVRAASQNEGWTGDLAGRAASALRLAGAFAIGLPVSQHDLEVGGQAGEGQLVVRRGLFGKRVVVSAAVTPGAAGRNRASSLWPGLSQAIAEFTTVRYGRNGSVDGVALDAALAEGQDLVKRLRWRQLLRFGRTRPSAVEVAPKPSWAR